MGIRMNEENIMVSINCITYNQEKYISDAIESFLMQKTHFKYEILIHDDASSDDTVNIIKKYEEQYPDIIKPVYEKENQYSKGIKVLSENSGRARGKYIAICEGDDFWNDPYKLQKQADYLEAHPECSLCVHAAYTVNSHNKRLRYKVRPRRSNGIVSIEETIYGGGGVFATNSMMYPNKLHGTFPYFCDIAEKVGVDDYPLNIYLALKGTIYYMDEYMSTYRVGIPGSWSVVNAAYEKHLNITNCMMDMLEELNQYTNFKYNTIIIKTKQKIEIEFLLMHKKQKEILSLDYYHSIEVKTKLKILICRLLPWLQDLVMLIQYD